ncbi:MAG TPA: phage major capsid protein [Pyrinomonadaceae bacterium]|jgi:HK97 family phage major capsid protein|nr:phage major capsid protein [Pyrinomonadaceae bacterium]
MPEIREILKRLRDKPVHRTFAIERTAVSAESRTVRLAFASDRPIEHWFGLLELSMKGNAMRTDRLDSGAPLLCDHDPCDIVGVVEGHVIGMDGIARATVRFGESARANEVFHDVKTGIRTNVSVGFMINSMEMIDKGGKDSPAVYRSTDWMPYEISLVSMPADISVGVGRSLKNKLEIKQMTEELQERTFASMTPLEKAQELRAWGKALKMEDAADQYIRNSIDPVGNFTGTEDGLRIFLRNSQPPSVQIPPMDPHTMAAQYGHGSRYDNIELARSVSRHKLQGFAGEGAEYRAHKFGQWVLATSFGNREAANWCANNGLSLSRSQFEGSNTKGGYLVPIEFGMDLVDLVERYGIFRQFAKIVPMSTDTRTDPVLEDELDTQFVAELQEGNDSDIDFEQITLSAKKHMVFVPMSNEVSEDSAISIGDIVATVAARAFAKKEDKCGFLGDGTSAYGGITGVAERLKAVDSTIANIASLQVGSGNAYSELTLLDFQGVVARLPEYADTGSARWFMSRSFYWNVVVKLVMAAPGATASEIEDARNGKFLGYPVQYVQIMPKAEANSQVCALFGDLSLAARLGDRRAMSIVIDPSILFRKDALLLRASSRFDINVFGVGNASATPADRVAGPIIGLITAAS